MEEIHSYNVTEAEIEELVLKHIFKKVSKSNRLINRFKPKKDRQYKAKVVVKFMENNKERIYKFYGKYLFNLVIDNIEDHTKEEIASYLLSFSDEFTDEMKNMNKLVYNNFLSIIKDRKLLFDSYLKHDIEIHVSEIIGE